MLLQGRRAADSDGKPFRVTGADDFVRRVLDITGVWGYLNGEPKSPHESMNNLK